jgi:hypothetical protein
LGLILVQFLKPNQHLPLPLVSREDSNLWGENIDEDFMNSIEETDPQFLNKLQQNGLDPYLMNKDSRLSINPVSWSKPSFVGFNKPTASDGLFLSIILVLLVRMEYVYKDNGRF